jgi:hypothetical protein
MQYLVPAASVYGSEGATPAPWRVGVLPSKQDASRHSVVLCTARRPHRKQKDLFLDGKAGEAAPAALGAELDGAAAVGLKRACEDEGTERTGPDAGVCAGCRAV